MTLIQVLVPIISKLRLKGKYISNSWNTYKKDYDIVMFSFITSFIFDMYHSNTVPF